MFSILRKEYIYNMVLYNIMETLELKFEIDEKLV